MGFGGEFRARLTGQEFPKKREGVEMRGITCLALAVCCGLSGCETALVSKRIDDKQENAASGLVYRLPKKQFDVAVTYELISCSAPANTVELWSKVTGTVTESVIGDDEQTYFLDYSKLAAATKISKIDIGVTDTGLLTSINSTMTDQTGPIIANVGSAAFNIARGIVLPGASSVLALDLKGFDPNALGLTGPAARAAVPVPKIQTATDLCGVFKKAKSEYDDAVKAAKTAATQAKTHADDLAALATRTALDAKLKEDESFYKQYGTAAQYKAATEALNTSKNALAAAQLKVRALESADTELEKANKTLAEAKAKMFIDHTFSFAPTRSQFGTRKSLEFSRIDSLFDTTVKPCTSAGQANCVELPSVTISVKPVAKQVTPNRDFKDGKAGIVYRLPAAAELEATTGANVIFLKQLTQVPQYGHIASLDLSNGVFADNLLKVTFSGNGAPTQLSFASQSQAEAASKAASQTAQAYFDFAKNKQQDKIDAAKTQIGLDKDRASANAAIASDNVTTLRQIQQLQALANGSASEATSQLDALSHQRDMLEAQLKILALQKQINDAKASLAAPSGQ